MERVFTKLNRYFGTWEIGVLPNHSGYWTVQPETSIYPYLKASNAQGKNILMRPTNSDYFLLIDDINWERIKKDHQYDNGSWKSGRLVVETSHQNYQVWLRWSVPLSIDQKKSLLVHFCSDPAAHPKGRFGRCPGFRNVALRHHKGDGRYPLAKLIWIHWAGTADGDYLGHISRENYDKGNDSQTDFAYALALMRRGASDEYVRQKLVVERKNWMNHQGQSRISSYLDRTIRNARKQIS